VLPVSASRAVSITLLMIHLLVEQPTPGFSARLRTPVTPATSRCGSGIS
jgi:hypothetical protein